MSACSRSWKAQRGTDRVARAKTATGEILRVIASSPTDTQPVFDLVAQRAGRLCNAEVAVVSSFDGKVIELAAIYGLFPKR
jgi:hypothetical protein